MAFMSDSDEAEMTWTLNDEDVKAEAMRILGHCSNHRRRPPYSKRRASRDATAWPPRKESKSLYMIIVEEEQIMINLKGSERLMEEACRKLKAEREAMILKQPAAKMVVEAKPKQMSFMSDSDEAEMTWTLNDGDVKKILDLGRCSSHRRRPPYSKRTASRDSKGSKSEDEQSNIAHEQTIEEACSKIQDKMEAMILKQPSDWAADLEIQGQRRRRRPPHLKPRASAWSIWEKEQLRIAHEEIIFTFFEGIGRKYMDTTDAMTLQQPMAKGVQITGL